MSRGRTASRQRALTRQERAGAARPTGSGRRTRRSLETEQAGRGTARIARTGVTQAQQHASERSAAPRAASRATESAVAVPSTGAATTHVGVVASLAAGASGAVAAAGARVYAWGMQVRRWAGNGLVDVWPEDANRLGEALRVGRGMPFLAARVATMHTGRWLRLHVVALTGVLLCAVLAALGAGLAYRAVASGGVHLSAPGAQSLLPLQSQQVGPGIVLQPQATPTPTVALPAYMVGAWPSASAPSGGATIDIFVRVTNRATLRPVSGAMVTLQVQVTCANPYRNDGVGPVATGVDGIAAIPVRVSGMPGGQPVCVTAIVRVGGKVYTATATFSPV